MINWELMSQVSANSDDKQVLSVLGTELKAIYVDCISDKRPESVKPLFETLLNDSVEETSKNSATNLEESYLNGMPPRRDDSENVGSSFVCKLFAQFHEAFCAELYENPDLSTNARGIIIVLAPTIITLLGLPLAYAALSIPISTIVTRIGIRTLCQDYEIKKKSKEFIKVRLEIHRKNLIFLEQAFSRQTTDSIPEIFREAIALEELKVLQLEDEIRSLGVDAAKLQNLLSEK